jgi:AcrR family transcriptional regulator
MADPSSGSTPPARADARRNRRRILDATIALVLETGGAPSRDAVAQRAGVGIATLYRHFADQPTLLHAVVLDVLDRAIHLGDAARREPVSGGEALRRYMHAAIDSGLGVVNVLHALLERQDWPDQRAAARDLLARLVDAARADGALDPTVTPADIAIAAIRFCRPLAIGLEPAEDRAIAHRHLDTYLDGLMPSAR